MRWSPIPSFPLCRTLLTFLLLSSIRLIFTIADIQTEEDFDEEETEAESDVEDLALYPVRATLSITKVFFLSLLA